MYIKTVDEDANVISSCLGELNKVVIQDLQEEGFIDIQINDKLVLHVKRNDQGYTVDFYRALPEGITDEQLDEYDFDADYIDSTAVWDDQLEHLPEEEEE